MNDFRLCMVSDDYISYLRKHVSNHVFSNEGDHYRHTRKYLGVVLSVNGYRYFAPLSSPKRTDYVTDSSGKRFIRKSIIPIMRITDRDRKGTAVLLATIKFSNMIPVPDKALIDYDISSETDAAYKTLVENELRYIKRHTGDIQKHASVIYKQKSEKREIGYLKNTLDFAALEKACDIYADETDNKGQ